MSKAKKYGFNRSYIPNAKADAYHRRKMHDKHMEHFDAACARAEERRDRREKQELKKERLFTD